MVKRCLVNNCDSKLPRNPIGAERLSFFSFPTNEVFSEEWRKAIYVFNNQKLPDTLSKYAVVCEKHFNKIDMIQTGKRRHLHCRAVPKLFPNKQPNEWSDNFDSSEKPFTIIKLEPHDQQDMLNETYPETANYYSIEETDSASAEGDATEHQKEYFKTINTNVMEQTNGCDVQFLETFKEESLDTSNEKLLLTSNENINDLNDVKREQAIQFFNEEQICSKESFECERCGHINTVTTRLKGGFFEENQLQQPNHTENSILPQIPPIFKNDPLSYESNHHMVDPELSTSAKKMIKKKRICYPGDVQEDEELGETSSQKYISVLRKKIAEQRKQAKTICQKNRRNEKRIATLKNLLQELMEKTMNKGHSVVEPELLVASKQ